MLLVSQNAPVPVYFKMLPSRGFWVETACLRLAEATGLPVGECYWGEITRENLPSSAMWQDGESQRMVVCVRIIRGATLYAMGLYSVANTLRKHQAFAKMCVLDELLANGDRHNENVMIDGKKCPILIDFGHAFGGPENPFTNTMPLFENEMLSEAIATMDVRRRQAFGVDLSDAINEIKDAMPTLNEALASCPFRSELLGFVNARMTVLRELLAIRLNIGQRQQALVLPTRPVIQR